MVGRARARYADVAVLLCPKVFHPMTTHRLLWSAVFVCGILSGASSPAQTTPPSDDRLTQILKRFPEADTDKNGVLSEAEARAHLKKFAAEKGGKPGAGFDRSNADRAGADLRRRALWAA